MTGLHPAEALARALVDARAEGRSLALAKDAMPSDLAGAYAVQDAALALVERPAAWKVGFVAPEVRHGLPIERFVGPAARLWRAGAEASTLPVIAGGFAAMEAEVVLRLASDVTAGAAPTGAGALRGLVDGVFAGIELAGSPLPDILDRGPIGAICDHGNCLGVLVGAALDPGVLDGAVPCAVSVEIDGKLAGRGTTDAVSGGPLASLAFLLGNLGARGISLSAGTMIATGALTGVHPVAAGQKAVVAFGGVPPLRVALA